MSIRIITNNVPRPVIYGYELSQAERDEFDYIDWAAVDAGETSPEFVRYRGDLHDLGEFSTTSELRLDEMQAWHGYKSDSFFSGLVVRYSDDFEYVTVGLYLS